MRPFGPVILRVFFQVFSCRQCYKKETLQNDMGGHGKTHIVAVSLQQNEDTDQRQCKSDMMKKSSVDLEEVFRRKQETKGVLAKAKSAKEKRSRKPAVDASLPWAGRF